jgi:polysaccharide export outer membrane protein
MNCNPQALRVWAGAVLLGFVLSAAGAAARQQAPPPKPAPGANGAAKPASPPPTDYVIGPEDVLTIIVYGQDPQLHSGDVVVRPDGKISRLLIDEIQAAGLTPLQLKAELTKAYSKFFQDPMILVNPKQINSRKVYITGNVYKPGEYPLNEEMDLLTLITKAGGLQEYADKENIRLYRTMPNGKLENFKFNYNALFEGKGPGEIPKLKPGDRVIVR